MKILYLAHRIPYPPNKGDKLRALRQIEWLTRRHQVWCACFVDDPHDVRHVSALRMICQDVVAIELRPFLAKLRGLWALIRGKTITEGFYDCPYMTALLAQWDDEIHFDAAVAFSSSMATYALNVRAPRRILDLCDLDSQKWLDYSSVARFPTSRMLQIEASRLATRELRWIDSFDAAILATQAEAAPLRALVPPSKLHAVGNGVEIPTTQPTAVTPASGPTVGFIGVMDYFPNVDAVCWFATHCWPSIRNRFPTGVFRIVGRRPTRAVRKLSRIPGVEVTGEVEDASIELARFDVSVAPLRIARGIQNKVLEAMAAGKAVVLTPQAATGVGAVANRNYLVAEQPTDFVDAVFSLLTEATKAQEIGTHARQFVAEHCRWERELEKFEALVTGGISRTLPAETICPTRRVSLPVLVAPLSS